ncbi:MAG: tetratricopeptide repeat protein [Planctomycetes bacterium]|nr:tetratricopeptide repeat protein [Planctomycetota bacterium]
MSIKAITSARAGILSALPQPASFRGKSEDGAPNEREAFGRSAFRLGDGGTSLTLGLYSSLGAFIGAAAARAALAKVPTEAQKARTASIKTIIAKIDSGNTKGGRQGAKKLLEKNANDVTALRLVAHSYIEEQDYKKAERSYLRAAALAPNSRAVKTDLANARTLQKSDDEVLVEARRKLKSPTHEIGAVRLLMRLTDRSPDNAEAYLALAGAFEKARKPGRELGALQEALKNADDRQLDEVISRSRRLSIEHPAVGLPRNILGRALEKAGRLPEALTELQTAIDVAPFNVSYRTDLANALITRGTGRLAAGDLVSTQADLHAAQAIDPANNRLGELNARLSARLAARDFASGRFTAAAGHLVKATADAPDDDRFKKDLANVSIGLGAHFRDKGDTALALTSYINALELDPTSLVARRNVGELSHIKGLGAVAASNYDSAITHLERAHHSDGNDLDYGPDLANAYNLRGQQRVLLGDLNGAIEDFKKGLTIDPTNASLDANLSSALLAS